jgi:hypothetical protein
LATARSLSARLSHGQANVREYVLNVGVYTREVKARILYNHLYFSALTTAQRDDVLAGDFYLQVIDHKNYNPRLIQLVTDPEYLALANRGIRETIESALANPQEIWDRPYRQHMTSEARIMMLALFVNGRSAALGALKASYVRMSRAFGIDLHPADVEASFRSTFRELEGSVLGLVMQVVIFTNPGLRDYLQGIVADDQLLP